MHKCYKKMKLDLDRDLQCVCRREDEKGTDCKTVVKRRKESHLEWKGKMSHQMWEGECGPKHSGWAGGMVDA